MISLRGEELPIIPARARSEKENRMHARVYLVLARCCTRRVRLFNNAFLFHLQPCTSEALIHFLSRAFARDSLFRATKFRSRSLSSRYAFERSGTRCTSLNSSDTRGLFRTRLVYHWKTWPEVRGDLETTSAAI